MVESTGLRTTTRGGRDNLTRRRLRPPSTNLRWTDCQHRSQWRRLLTFPAPHLTAQCPDQLKSKARRSCSRVRTPDENEPVASPDCKSSCADPYLQPNYLP